MSSKRLPKDLARRSSRPPSAHTLGHEVSATVRAEGPPTRPRAPAPPPSVVVRGPVLASIDGGVERLFGEEGRERVVALLPDRHSLVMRRGRPEPLEAHDVELVRLYCDLASRVFSLTPADFKKLGREAVENELAPFLRTVMLPGKLSEVLARSVSMLARFADFGTWSVDQDLGDFIVIRVDEFVLATPLLRAFYVGVIEGIVHLSVASEIRVQEVRSAEAASGRFEIEVARS